MSTGEQIRKSIHSGARISLLDAESKAILNSINVRLNDIDLKLSFVLELLANRLPEKPTGNGKYAGVTGGQLPESTGSERSAPRRVAALDALPLNSDAAVAEIASGDSDKLQQRDDDMKPETSRAHNNESEGEEDEMEDYDDDLDEVPLVTTDSSFHVCPSAVCHLLGFLDGPSSQVTGNLSCLSHLALQ